MTRCSVHARCCLTAGGREAVPEDVRAGRHAQAPASCQAGCAHPSLCAVEKAPFWNMCCGRRERAEEEASAAAEAGGRGARR